MLLDASHRFLGVLRFDANKPAASAKHIDAVEQSVKAFIHTPAVQAVISAPSVKAVISAPSVKAVISAQSASPKHAKPRIQTLRVSQPPNIPQLFFSGRPLMNPLYKHKLERATAKLLFNP